MYNPQIFQRTMQEINLKRNQQQISLQTNTPINILINIRISIQINHLVKTQINILLMKHQINTNKNLKEFKNLHLILDNMEDMKRKGTEAWETMVILEDLEYNRISNYKKPLWLAWENKIIKRMLWRIFQKNFKVRILWTNHSTKIWTFKNKELFTSRLKEITKRAEDDKKIKYFNFIYHNS